MRGVYFGAGINCRICTDMSFVKCIKEGLWTVRVLWLSLVLVLLSKRGLWMSATRGVGAWKI